MSNVAAIAALDAITARTHGGMLRVFTGTAPATCESSDTGTRLATLTLSSTAFPGASDGGNKAVALANAIGEDIDADDSGVPGHWRLYSNSGACVIQGTAGGPGSGAEGVFNKSPFEAGDTVQIVSMVLEMPEGN